MNIIPYFLLLDSFGIKLNFYVKGNKDYRSHLGGFVTLVIYIVTIICAVIFANELKVKSNPKISTASAIYNNPTKIYYPNDIFFMISISVNSTPFIDDKIYRVVGYIRSKINGTESFLEKNITLDKCSNVFNEKYKYYNSIRHINLSHFYCISLDKNINNGIREDELFINEFWGNDGFQMLQIKVYNCTAIAEDKNECQPNNIIQEKLKSAIITYYTLKNNIDTNNFQHPYIRGLEEAFYYVSYKKYISVTEYLKHVEIHSDIGLLFYQEEIHPDSTVDSMKEFTEIEPDDGKLFAISLQLTNKIEIYNRSYYKIQDLGADIGAIYGALHMVLAILFQFYNTSKLFTNVINNFFLIKEDFKPLSRTNRSFINLKTKFYNDLKLDISLKGKNSFCISQSTNKNIEENLKTNDCLTNENMKRSICKNDNILNLDKNLKEHKIRKNKDEIDKADFLKKILKKKKEEEKRTIKINFSFIDRFLCLYLINLCTNRVNRYSYYNLFYKGKDYIIKVLDITNYLKFNHFLHMFFIINEKEKKQLYDYVTTPILSSNYVGPRFEADKEK